MRNVLNLTPILYLREFSPKQSLELVKFLLKVENLPPSIETPIWEKSQGNPLFIEEIVHSIIESGFFFREADAQEARKEIESITAPQNIQSIILSRVDRLEQNGKRFLESASIIGGSFRRRLLESMMVEAEDLEDVLLELEEHGLIYRKQEVPEEEYAFRHALTQETIYQSILRWGRAVLHQRAAEAMEHSIGMIWPNTTSSWLITTL